MVIPINYRKAADNVIASYNYTDVASGTGIIELYAAATLSGSGVYCLSDYKFYSEPICTIGTTEGKCIDKDFDVLINRPLTIKGTGIVNVPFSVYTSSEDSTGYVQARLRKWDGATETEIAASISGSTLFVVDGSVGTLYRMSTLSFTIPQTTFKKGEYLRLTIEGYVYHPDPGTFNIRVAHDPMGRITGWDATAAVPSTLIFQCPVRIDL